MKTLFQKIINSLIERKQSPSPIVQNPKPIKSIKLNNYSKIQSHDKPFIINSIINPEYCIKILNYWLDSELFDIPECPMDKKGVMSQAATLFEQEWGEEANLKYRKKEINFTSTSRLVIMFQCHRANYILEKDEHHPNYIPPRTYLISQAMIPIWDEKEEIIRWKLSEDNEDLNINIAIMRTLYRKCSSSIPNNMSLSEWISARKDTIDALLNNFLIPKENEKNFTTKELAERIKKINRQLATEFWPDTKSQQYMNIHTQPIDSQHEYKDDSPYYDPNKGILTFKWRFCFYPETNENTQLGPFFVKDIENIIKKIKENGAENALSLPLYKYLTGSPKQFILDNAVNAAEIYQPLTKKCIKGRWPENPDYGLSLLQTVAVNIASNKKNNPIVAVNGPPGTGKTTLLKDIIAQNFVQRTEKLLEYYNQDLKSFYSEKTIKAILDHSIIVASSNNKAVENISRELPSLSKISAEYQPHIHHFKQIVQDDDWGIFCAVLGNNENRKIFKDKLNKLKDHLTNLNDHYQIQYLFFSLKKSGRENASNIISRFIHSWIKQDKLIPLINEIKISSAYKKFNLFFKPFCEKLNNIFNQEITINHFSEDWKNLNDKQWDYLLEGLDLLKRQWFAKKLATTAINKKLEKAKVEYLQAQLDFSNMEEDIAQHKFNKWKLEPIKHLLNNSAYTPKANETEEQAESRIQMSSPLGSKEANHCRTNLFIKALALNEAIIEITANELENSDWENLFSLIDGQLITQEIQPNHDKLWALLFLFFPVLSTSLASVENQFKLMQKTAGFGTAMFDEAGQAVNYHVIGLLQRCKQAIFVGDPIQLEPIVKTPPNIDHSIARDFIQISDQDKHTYWGDYYLITQSSAQSLADRACNYIANIGNRTVGIPLLVHRRCTEPMFSIANKIAYDGKMILATQPCSWKNISSGWINIEETINQVKTTGYANKTETKQAFELIKFLCKEYPEMVKGGVYIITPFTKMRHTLQKHWDQLSKQPENHDWLKMAVGKDATDFRSFRNENIGTVHTFQGKEASTVLLCTAASKLRKNEGGIKWVNSKPNLINVAVTRAKHHLFILGNGNDWSMGNISKELQINNMKYYPSLKYLMDPTLPIIEKSESDKLEKFF
ncbi:hypothetical protein CEP49_04215 [Mergibacter septicus]|uniref:DEAD/DEAH box helicase n=1 Tax=Mergibacter septicus TaxID=221402 RepID=UPI0011796C57|nr:AAA domain-containing protein [Mergibacter septicus]AWX13814.1 hypothetical protein CEP49_04215 [Mergibacter septicus]